MLIFGMDPFALFYNCDAPDRILADCVIKPSKVFTGVSLSEWSELGSHGPFKIEFRLSTWLKQCIPVVYWEITRQGLRRIHEDTRPKLSYYAKNQFGKKVSEQEFTDGMTKYQNLLISLCGSDKHLGRIWKSGLMFKDEREWYSPLPIHFSLDDVQSVTFMLNAPCLLSSRKINQIKAVLCRDFGNLYRERVVNDHYLKERA